MFVQTRVMGMPWITWNRFVREEKKKNVMISPYGSACLLLVGYFERFRLAGTASTGARPATNKRATPPSYVVRRGQHDALHIYGIRVGTACGVRCIRYLRRFARTQPVLSMNEPIVGICSSQRWRGSFSRSRAWIGSKTSAWKEPGKPSVGYPPPTAPLE